MQAITNIRELAPTRIRPLLDSSQDIPHAFPHARVTDASRDIRPDFACVRGNSQPAEQSVIADGPSETRLVDGCRPGERHVAVSSCATCCCNSVKLVGAGVGSSDGPFRPAVPGAAMARPISQAHADPCARFEAAKMSWIEPAEGPRPAQSFKTNRSGASRQIGPEYGTQRPHEEPRRERPLNRRVGRVHCAEAGSLTPRFLPRQSEPVLRAA
jgi:hypothetical protein